MTAGEGQAAVQGERVQVMLQMPALEVLLVVLVQPQRDYYLFWVLV